jgi:hypothetical protein
LVEERALGGASHEQRGQQDDEHREGGGRAKHPEEGETDGVT